VLKGGVLITSLLGIEARATVDLDATMRAKELSIEDISEIIGELLRTDIDDSVIFTLKEIEETRVEVEYPGFRVTLNVMLDKLRDTVKLDFTAGDVITPKPIEYGYKLMFEDRKIQILAYNLETVLAEKFITVLSLDISNTRMKDFYDIYMLLTEQRDIINPDIFTEAVSNTAKQRHMFRLLSQATHIVDAIAENTAMSELWKRYKSAYAYAADIEFSDVITALKILLEWYEL
jgi:hypothetical protein